MKVFTKIRILSCLKLILFLYTFIMVAEGLQTVRLRFGIYMGILGIAILVLDIIFLFRLHRYEKFPDTVPKTPKDKAKVSYSTGRNILQIAFFLGWFNSNPTNKILLLYFIVLLALDVFKAHCFYAIKAPEP